MTLFFREKHKFNYVVNEIAICFGGHSLFFCYSGFKSAISEICSNDLGTQITFFLIRDLIAPTVRLCSFAISGIDVPLFIESIFFQPTLFPGFDSYFDKHIKIKSFFITRQYFHKQ